MLEAIDIRKYLAEYGSSVNEDGSRILESVSCGGEWNTASPSISTRQVPGSADLSRTDMEVTYHIVSGPRTTGDGYYESCVVAIENNQIEFTV